MAIGVLRSAALVAGSASRRRRAAVTSRRARQRRLRARRRAWLDAQGGERLVGTSMTWTDPPAASILATAVCAERVGDDEQLPVDLALAEDLERLVERAHGADRPEQLLVDRDRGRLGARRRPCRWPWPGQLAGLERAELDEAAIRPRLTTRTALERVLEAAQLGDALWSGVWPPSNQAGIEPPARAFWPFVPRPAVLPRPAAMPRPTRVRARARAGRGAQVVELHAFSLDAGRGSSSTVTMNWTCADHARGSAGVVLDLDLSPIRCRPRARRSPGCARCG